MHRRCLSEVPDGSRLPPYEWLQVGAFSLNESGRMIPPHYLKAFVLLLAIFCLPICHGQSAAQFDTEKLLEELEKLEAQNAEAMARGVEALEEQFRAAAQNSMKARNLYYQSRRLVDFEGKGMESLKFREWEQKFEEALSQEDQEEAFEQILQMHLTWLAMTMRRHRLSEEEIPSIIPDVERYAQGVANFSREYEEGGRGEARNVLNELWKRSVAGSSFLRAHNADQYLSGLKEWELVPSNYQGIYEQTLLPYWREQQNPKALEYWAMRISLLEEAIANSDLELVKQRMSSIERPQLLWQRANEYVEIGQPTQGILAMYEVLKANPNHPDFKEWIETIRGLVENPTADVPETAGN